MVVLNNSRTVQAGLVWICAVSCAPLDITVFDDGPNPERPPVMVGVGGTAGEEDDSASMGGQPASIEFLLDDFEDGDSKANAPAEWWYPVNDGTGTQTLNIIEANDLTMSTELAQGNVLQIFAENFSDWGSAWGVDVGNVVKSGPSLELSFSMAADRSVEVTLHALDGSGDHFTRTLTLTPTWARFVVRLDQLLFVDAAGVQSFDVATATELQWFIFGAEPTTVWLDNVVVRSF